MIKPNMSELVFRSGTLGIGAERIVDKYDEVIIRRGNSYTPNRAWQGQAPDEYAVQVNITSPERPQ